MRRLAAALALGLVIPAGARPAVLERVEVVEDGGPLVRLHVSEPVTPVAHALPAEGNLPARIYLDLPVTALLPAAAPRRGVGPLLRVRLGRFDAGTVRVVLDLATAMPFTVETGTRTVNVRLGPAPAKAERPTPPPPGSPADAAPGPPAPPPVATPPSPPPPVAVLPPPPAEMAKAPEPSDVQAEAPPELSKVEPAPQAKSAKRSMPKAEAAPPAAVVKVPRHSKPSVRPPAPPPAPAETAQPAEIQPEAPVKSEMPSSPSPAEVPRPSAPASRPPSTTKPLPLVIIDPGHGGHDPGAAGVGGIVEKDVVLDVARRLAVKLATRLPVSVVLTRLDDSYVPIERRVPEVAEAALFLSLHANACHDASARGVEVFYGGGNGGLPGNLAANRAMLLGRAVESALATVVGGVRGDARPGTFAVLARNAVPGVLVEIGYLTHPGDAARACDGAYQDLLTDALVEGVRDFLRVSAPVL